MAKIMDIHGMPKNACTDSVHRYFPVSARDREWGCYAVTAGYARIPPRSTYPPPGHPPDHRFEWTRGRILHEYALVYLASGRGVFESAGRKRRRVESGQILFLFPGVWHRYRPDPVTGWTEYWIGFDGNVPRRLHRKGFFSEKKTIYRVPDEGYVLQLFQMMVSAVEENRSALQQVLAGIAVHLLGALYARNRHPKATPPAAGRGAIQKALEIAQASLILPPDLHRQVGLSDRTFRREFKRHTGLSPHQYGLQLRLAKARGLLMDTSKSVKEIAALCGFQDEQYFSRLFKRKAGMSPRQWRMAAVVSLPSQDDRTGSRIRRSM